MYPFQIQVSLMRIFRRVKTAFADTFSGYHDLNAPFTLMRRNPQQPDFVGFGGAPHVLQITIPRYFAKIAESVVLFISVFVVDMPQRKIACHIQPCQSVRKPFLIIDCNSPVARVCWTARTFADKIGTALMSFPNKLSSIWVVNKNGSKMVSGNHDIEFTIGAAN